MMSENEIDRMPLGRTGPIQIARLWTMAVLREHDLRRAWLVTHPDLRRKIALAWVDVNKDHPRLQEREHAGLVPALAAAESDDPIWPAFSKPALEELGQWLAEVDLGTWGWVSAPILVGSGRELVWLTPLPNPNLRKVDTYYRVGGAGREVSLRGRGLFLQQLKPEETEGVQVFMGETENLWRVVERYPRREILVRSAEEAR